MEELLRASHVKSLLLILDTVVEKKLIPTSPRLCKNIRIINDELTWCLSRLVRV